jgi:hypothetical protein
MVEPEKWQWTSSRNNESWSNSFDEKGVEMTTLCSAFKISTVGMHTFELRCLNRWVRFAVATRKSEMRDAPGDPMVTNRMLLFVQFCEMIRMSFCEPSRTHCQFPRKQFPPICRRLAIPLHHCAGFPTLWQVSWNKFVSLCVDNCSRSSVHTRTIISGISLRGMRVGLIIDMFGAGYGPHGMKTHLKWKIGPLPARKLCWRFCGVLTASMLWIYYLRVNRSMHHGS